MKIGNVEINGRVALGPMAGITDMPFRGLCARCGAGLTFTEMISAKGLFYGNKNSVPLLKVSPFEGTVAVQLFGSEPELMADEAVKLQGGPYDIFDINMGCPMPKIVNNGEGSALMTNPTLVHDIVKAMADALDKPVTVKIRKGFREANAVEVAKAAEEGGAAAVTVHGRTREEYYSGKADWDIIRQVKEAVRIPVIGSGDVTDGESAQRMLEETGCDMVMVARAARGNPWIFAEINAYLNGQPVPARPTKDEVKNMITEQMEEMVRFAGEWSAVRQMRKHVAFYCTGYPAATQLRRDINGAQTLEEFYGILTKW